MKQLNWYQIFGQTHTIPDGRTVTPTDDIQIWLNCADIWDKTYTTLAEVLADTDTLSALIASNNAVDYMVRSTTWAVAPKLIPVMTDNTHPSGVASASSSFSNTYPYYAFDGTSSTWWASASSGTQYIRYKFDNATVVNRLYMITAQMSRSDSIVFQGSNDGSNWTTIKTLDRSAIIAHDQQPYIERVANNIAYLYYQIYMSTNTLGVSFQELNFFNEDRITDDSTAMSYIGLNNYCANTLLADSTWCEAILKSEYVKSVCNVYVPKMTSNTTPSGVASASSIFDSNFPAWKAFDGDETTRWAVTAGSSLNSYIQYKFTEPVKINWVTMISGLYNNQPRIIAYKISGSNDGVTFTDLKNFTTNADGQDIGKVLDNSTAYMYYRQTVTNYRENVNEPMLQFYGREDV